VHSGGSQPLIEDPHLCLEALFQAMVTRADPMETLAPMLGPRPKGRVVVIGAGKASARMAEAVEAAWGACEGLVITRYGYGRPCQGIEIHEASHPVPDQAGAEGAQRLLSLAHSLGPEDHVLCLMSGGASALLTLPPEGVELSDLQLVSDGLLKAGAPIEKINTVRRHLCQIKGGRLGVAVHPARMRTMIISDVAGDDLAFVGSGPTVGHSSSAEDALAVLARFLPDAPNRITEALRKDRSHVTPEDPRLSTVENVLYVSPAQALAHVRKKAEGMGLSITDLGAEIEGEAREIAQDHAARVRALATDPAVRKPHLMLSGGELTVTARGDGIGGPNAEYALALAMALARFPGVHAMACDTDGVDGAAEVAGAYIHPDTLQLAAEVGVDPAHALAENDAHNFHAATGGQVVTGPTLTNVNDFRAILIL